MASSHLFESTKCSFGWEQNQNKQWKALVYQARAMAPRRTPVPGKPMKRPQGSTLPVDQDGPCSPWLRSFYLLQETKWGVRSPLPFPPPEKLHSEIGRQLDSELGEVVKIWGVSHPHFTRLSKQSLSKSRCWSWKRAARRLFCLGGIIHS